MKRKWPAVGRWLPWGILASSMTAMVVVVVGASGWVKEFEATGKDLNTGLSLNYDKRREAAAKNLEAFKQSLSDELLQVPTPPPPTQAVRLGQMIVSTNTANRTAAPSLVPLTPTPVTDTVLASGTVKGDGYVVNFMVSLPKKGGSFSGSGIGTCNGVIDGIYDKAQKKVKGIMKGTCQKDSDYIKAQGVFEGNYYEDSGDGTGTWHGSGGHDDISGTWSLKS